MSKENLKKLEQLNQHLKDIRNLCDESGGITKALSDTYCTQPAIMMHFVVACECLRKLQNNNALQELSIFTKEEINGLTTIRNISTHNYEGIYFSTIENTIRYDLPKIMEKIHKFLDQNKEIAHKNEDVER